MASSSPERVVAYRAGSPKAVGQKVYLRVSDGDFGEL